MKNSRLIKLRVKNFRSFNDEQSIVFIEEGQEKKCVTALYGPNASGKSNVIRALQTIHWFILNSNDTNITELPSDPFLLNTETLSKPSEFEIEFKQNDRHFIYGFAIDKKIVHKEYLSEFASKTDKLRTIFKRDHNGLNATAEKYKFGKKLYSDTLASALLITKARGNNNEYSNIIFDWLASVNFLVGTPQETMSWSANQLRTNPEMVKSVIELLHGADLWIRSFEIEDVDMPQEITKLFNEETLKNLRKPTGAYNINTAHALRDKNKKIVGEQLFQLLNHESSGTQKFFELATPLVDTLENGKVLYLDEFGSYLHADMCDYIVSLFKSTKNKHGAQLIINTHDTSLMRQDGPLSRDDIIFVEKNYAEESIVHTLNSKSVRQDESFEKRYRQGFYGAKPQIEKI